MRENVNRDNPDAEEYGYRSSESEEKRLDLNDLLNRVKTQRKNDRKQSIYIFFGMLAIVLVCYLVLSL
tara:strand:+ start:364 stop:567 length:204 start_codon:yes stop_codon:yes gene_type:complete